MRLRRTCVVVALLAGAWALAALGTGGASFQFAFLHLSSRNPRNPALIALIAAAAALLLADGDRTQQVMDDLHWVGGAIRRGLQQAWAASDAAAAWLERLPGATASSAAIAIAAAVIVVAIRETAAVAAGSDAWGYVSQAHMWATWTLRVPEPLLDALNGFLPREALAPLAYRPSPEGATIVPVTSPGLPMVMAVFERLGGRHAVFAVVPLLAALTVWSTYLLGRRLSGPWSGVVAAALLATSPAFLFQITSAPMSDIPAAAWWTLSLVFALQSTPGNALASGVTAGVAILTRANLAPVALIPALIAFRGPNGGRYRRVLCYATGAVPAAIFIAALYNYWYGSPLNSGYGTLGQLYSLGNVWPNVSRFSTWLMESQTPAILIAVAAPLLVSGRDAAVRLLLFCLSVAACYVFYIPFDAWWYLRFLLPAFPALMALTAASIIGLASRAPRQMRALVVVTAVVLLAGYTVRYAGARATFDTDGEQKYAITGRYVADHLPANAVVISEIYSGAIRYYSDRATIRFSWIPADHLERAVAELQRRGLRPYLVAEDWEEAAFRRQFAGRTILSALDAGPEATLPLGNVRIYPLAR